MPVIPMGIEFKTRRDFSQVPMWNSRRGPGMSRSPRSCLEMRRRHSLRLSGTRKKSIASCAKHGSSWNVHEWIMIMTCATSHAMVLWYHDVSWCIMFKIVAHRFAVARAASSLNFNPVLLKEELSGCIPNICIHLEQSSKFAQWLSGKKDRKLSGRPEHHSNTSTVLWKTRQPILNWHSGVSAHGPTEVLWFQMHSRKPSMWWHVNKRQTWGCCRLFHHVPNLQAHGAS